MLGSNTLFKIRSESNEINTLISIPLLLLSFVVDLCAITHGIITKCVKSIKLGVLFRYTFLIKTWVKKRKRE